MLRLIAEWGYGKIDYKHLNFIRFVGGALDLQNLINTEWRNLLCFPESARITIKVNMQIREQMGQHNMVI